MDTVQKGESRRMKVLFTIPHVYNPFKGGKNASTTPNPTPRIQGLTKCILALHQIFGAETCRLDFVQGQAVELLTSSSLEIDIIVFTTRGLHLLNHIDLPSSLYRRMELDVDPMLLGFECQRVLAEESGNYDYFCFLEDDSIIHDPFFFRKLQWFTSQFGDECLLQPNRFEVGYSSGKIRKLYPDGDLRPESTAKFRAAKPSHLLKVEVLGQTVCFESPSNPHAGCYFLNAAQMKMWAAKPWFLDRSPEWIGPLESAATLGIMRTFGIYKAAHPHADFFGMEHFGASYLATVGTEFPFERNKNGLGLWALRRRLRNFRSRFRTPSGKPRVENRKLAS